MKQEGGVCGSGTIRYSTRAASPADLKSLRSFDGKKIADGMDDHLSHEPTETSKSRLKEMTQLFWCQYRLRIDDFRVYYDVDEEKRKVVVLRIIEKGGSETSESANHETD
jgi:mRNA interferase RelE/StbE